MSNLCKKFISIILTLALTILSSFVALAETSTDSDYPRTGLVVTEDELANLEEFMIDTPQTYAVLPTSVDNTAQFPTPGNQGNQSSCVA